MTRSSRKRAGRPPATSADPSLAALLELWRMGEIHFSRLKRRVGCAVHRINRERGRVPRGLRRHIRREKAKGRRS